MKRILLIAAYVSISIATFASNFSAECKLPGTYGYAKVQYSRSEGVLIVSTQTDMNTNNLAELTIKVTCTHKWKPRAVKPRGSTRPAPEKWQEEEFVIFDQTCTNLELNKSFKISEGITNPSQDTNTDYYTNFQVYISSPICGCSK